MSVPFLLFLHFFSFHRGSKCEMEVQEWPKGSVLEQLSLLEFCILSVLAGPICSSFWNVVVVCLCGLPYNGQLDHD